METLPLIDKAPKVRGHSAEENSVLTQSLELSSKGVSKVFAFLQEL